MPHQRRRSGHGLSANNSATDVRKLTTSRPGMTRRQTPVNAQKLGRSQRERERERQTSWDDERESFPQYCMTCEKQFIPRDDRFLYCSETCRKVDQNSSSHGVSVRNYNDGSYSISAGSHPEPKDIIPRASPSRPNSMLFNSSPPASPGALYDQYRQPSSAITALRSLNVRPPSPPSPSGGSSIWPFSRSPIQTPSTSYSRPSAAFFSSTYDVGMGSNNPYTHDLGPRSMDRPLPSRRPGSDARPRSIELVTPMIGR